MDIPKPDDPHNVLNGNWPPESESAYHSAATHWGDLSRSHDQAGTTTTGHAQQVAAEFIGESGGTYAQQLMVDAGKFRANSASAASISATLEAAGDYIAKTKSAMTADVELANANPEKDKGVIESMRKEVAAQKASLDSYLEELGNYLENGGSPNDTPAQSPDGGAGAGPEDKVDPKASTGDPTGADGGAGGLPENAPTGADGGAGGTPSNAPPGTTPGTGSGSPGTGSGSPGTGSGSPGTGSGSPGTGSGSPGTGSGSGGAGEGAGSGGGSGGGGDAGGGSSIPESGGGGGDPVGGGGMPGGGMPGGGMPMGGMPQMPQIPQQLPGQDLASKGMDSLKDMIKGDQGQGGQQNGTSIDDDTLNKLLDAQNSDDDEPGTELTGDDEGSGAEHGTGADSIEKMSTPANPAHGLTGGSIPGMQGPSPASPVVTATPGMSHGPHTELSGAAGAVTTPDTLGPASAHTPPASPAGAPGMMPGMPIPPPGTGGGAELSGKTGKPTVYGSSDKGRSGRFGTWSSAYAAELSEHPGNTSPESAQASTFTSPGDKAIFLDSLPSTTSTAHQVLAALSEQFLRATWAATPIAVGMFRTGSPEGQPKVTIVYATADGVSMCPYGATLPPGVVPLSRVDGVGPRFISAWSGVRRVADKLIEFASDYPELLGELEAVVVNEAARSALNGDSDGLVTVQSNDERKQVIEAGRTAPASVTRVALSLVDAAMAPVALGQADSLFGDGVSETPKDSWNDEYLRRAARLWAARRSNPNPDGGYDAVMASYLLAEAHAALSEGRADEAGYSIGELLTIEPVSA